MSVKSVPLSKVQALACEFVFSQLGSASEAYTKAETMAKNRFAVVLDELGLDASLVNTARYEGGPGGAKVEYDVADEETGVIPDFDPPPKLVSTPDFVEID